MKNKDNFFKNNPLVISMIYLLLVLAIPEIFTWRIIGNNTTDVTMGDPFKMPMRLIYLVYCLILITLGISTFYLIRGKKIWIHKKGTIKWAIKQTKIWWIINVIGRILSIPVYFAFGEHVLSDWFPRIICCLLLSIFIGIFEEITFRAIINDSMINQFSNNKKIQIWIATLSFLFFGVMHGYKLRPFRTIRNFTSYWKNTKYWAHGIGFSIHILENS